MNWTIIILYARTSLEVCTSFEDLAYNTLTDSGGWEELAYGVHFDSLRPLIILTKQPIKMYLNIVYNPVIKYNVGDAV